MKRVKAWFLLLIMVFSMASMFTGCVDAGANSPLSMGQWLTMVADSFGLAGYTEEKPFFEKVPSTSSYFPVFQAVAEWEILEPSAEIDAKTPVKWKDVLISLVNAGEFVDLAASDEEKINYAIEHFDSSIRSYWMKRNIKMVDACALLEKAQNMWVDRRYTEKVEKLTVTDEVVDYLDQKMEYTEDNDVITIDADLVADLKPGDVYTLPATNRENASINRVSSIEIVDGKAIITNDPAFTEEEAMEYVEEVVIQDTSEVDLEQIDGMYDENGNPIEFTVDPEEDLLADMGIGDAQVVPLSNLINGGGSCEQLGFFDNVKGTLKFEIPDKNDKNVKWVAKLTIKKSSMAIRLSREKLIADSTYKEVKQESYVQAGFSNMEITRDVDYSWGKLKSATVKLNYKTELEGGVTITKDHDIGVQANKDGQAAISSAQTIQQYKDAISSMKTAWRDSKNSKADDIYICRLALLEGGVASLDLVVKGKVTVTGEVKLVVTITGSTGLQYKNNKVRYIKKSTTDVDFMADGKLEATITPGVELTILKKFIVVDFGIDLGLGAAFKLTTHLLDTEGHRLYSGKADLSGEQAEALSSGSGMVMTKEEVQEFLIEQGIQWDTKEETPTTITFAPGFCFDWRVYPIVKVSVGSKKSLVGKLMTKFEVEFSYEILGEDDAILWGHYDFPGNDPLGALKEGNVAGAILTEILGLYRDCSLENNPWPENGDLTEGDNTETTTNETLPISDDIQLDTYRIFLDEGESYYITVTGLPDGYTVDDLEVVVEDKKVAEFDDALDRIIAKKAGVTQAIVRIKDTAFGKAIAITVSEKAPAFDFEFGASA